MLNTIIKDVLFIFSRFINIPKQCVDCLSLAKIWSNHFVVFIILQKYVL